MATGSRRCPTRPHRGPRLTAAVAVMLLAALNPGAGPAAGGAAPSRAGAVPTIGLSAYLPAGVEYDDALPTPASVLGHEVGERHVRPDQIVEYMRVVASASDRAVLVEHGRTHERRPQLLLILTSPTNHARLEQIRTANLRLTDPDRAPSDRELDSMPAVVHLGYSIHGDEASGSNASLLVAYHLAAARGETVERLLDELVVLVDPSLNPDGLGRFALWANMHRGSVPVPDPVHREHAQGWPPGRGNHYWFDLNRDWLLLQHPESRARVATLRRWSPELIGDYHEMGSESTFFFQPGTPTRENPLKLPGNIELTRRLAAFHAAALDVEGELYYSEQTFDDFYPGKGSTYPDLAGSVGVLFEQASARGHVRQTRDRLLWFGRAIKNQFATSLSMLDGAKSLRVDLLRYKREFFRQARRDAARDDVAGYAFGDPDRERVRRMIGVLHGHGIEVRHLERPVSAGGKRFGPGDYFVPLAQSHYRLVRTLFETRTEFADSTFYDVSAWTLPLSFGIDYAAVPRRGADRSAVGDVVSPAGEPVARQPGESYAYLIRPEGYLLHRAIRALHEAGVQMRVATRPFEALDGETFPEGSLVIASGRQSIDRPALARLIGDVATANDLDVRGVDSGQTSAGVDLGSPSIVPLPSPKVLLLVGEGVSSTEAGEVWHLLDERFELPVTMVETRRLGRVKLEEYTHLLMVHGSYGTIGDERVARLREWVRAGGAVVATKGAAFWAAEKLLTDDGDKAKIATGADAKTQKPAAADESKPSYADYERLRAESFIAGAIFATRLDRSHPVAFGYTSDTLPVFRNSSRVMTPSDNPYENLALYAGEPLLAGFASSENLSRIANSAAVIASRVGAGVVIRFADNPNFRGVWYGTNRLYLNAIFFSPLIKRTAVPD